MTEYPSTPSSRKWAYIFVIILTFLLITGFFIITYLTVQNQLFAIQTSLNDQNTQLQNLQHQFELLDYINQSGFIPWPEIYNQIRHSIVFIQTNFGLGSGFVYDQNGHIITNFHVIEDTTTIFVTFLDGTILKASPVGNDPYSDLSIIKVDANAADLFPVILGNSSSLTVGEPVAAIGNPFGLSHTVTTGIISSLQRDLRAPGGYLIVDVIQTDAAINPGNSGGPLVNLKGQVVGINTAIIAGEEETTFLGVGFAIPSDTITREIGSLIETGKYTHPWVGITATDVDLNIAQDIGLEKPLGILITNVNSSSPAEKAGLQNGDVIVKLDNQSMRTLSDLVIYIERTKQPGDQVSVTIIRNSTPLNSIDLQLGERPPPT